MDELASVAGLSNPRSHLLQELRTMRIQPFQGKLQETLIRAAEVWGRLRAQSAGARGGLVEEAADLLQIAWELVTARALQSQVLPDRFCHSDLQDEGVSRNRDLLVHELQA